MKPLSLLITRNPLVLALGTQVIVYSLLAPWIIHAVSGSPDRYLWILLLYLVFFVVPLAFLSHLFLDRRPLSPILEVEVAPLRGLIAAVCFLVFEGIYWLSVLRAGLLTRRVGTEEIAAIFSDLSSIELAVLRMHDTTGLVMPAIFMVVALRATASVHRRIAALLFVVATTSFLVHTFSNSRLQFVIGCLVLGLAYLQVIPRPIDLRRAFGMSMLALAAAYAVILIANVRGVVAADQSLTLGLLMPFGDASSEIAASTSEVLVTEWLSRLDCVDLVAQMYPSIEANGLELGIAWRNPLFMIYGSFTDSVEYEMIKASAMTTAKAYLIEEHTALGVRDYYSCALTDAFANFGVLGLLAAAVYFALAVYFVQRSLSASRPVIFLVALVGVTHVALFEAEMISHLLGWIRLLPALLLVLFFSPIAALRRERGKTVHRIATQ